MKFRVIYCNHETSPLALRERLAFSRDEDYARGFLDLSSKYPGVEAIILSTCNRVEIYLACSMSNVMNRKEVNVMDRSPDLTIPSTARSPFLSNDPLPNKSDIARWLADLHQVPLDDLLGTLIEKSDVTAVRHLFEVACSLDSMVLGESQIVNQVKAAYQIGLNNNIVGPLIHSLFQDALRTASDVRAKTKLSDGKISVASVAIGEFGKNIFDRFDDKHVLILGAGEMAEETLRYLQAEKIKDITVINRTFERAERLAQSFNGKALPWDQLWHVISQADIVISTVTTEDPIITLKQLAPLREEHHHTMLLLDLGTPRNIDPAIGQLDDALFLYDIDDLEQTSHKNRQARAGQIEQAKLMIDKAIDRFLKDSYHHQTGPIITQLRNQWHQTSQEELQKLHQKLSHLSPSDHDQIERTIERIINKLLHPPLETIKDHSKEGIPHVLLESVRKLFRLGE